MALLPTDAYGMIVDDSRLTEEYVPCGGDCRGCVKSDWDWE